MITTKTPLLFMDANAFNIPLEVRLFETEDANGEKDGTWTLSAANYMPGINEVRHDSYKVVSDKKEELVELIQQYVLPFYQSMVERLQAICEGRA